MAKIFIIFTLSVGRALAYGSPPPMNSYFDYPSPPPPSYISPGYLTSSSEKSYGPPQPYGFKTKHPQCLRELCHWNTMEYAGLLNVPDRWDPSRLDIGEYHNPSHPIPWSIAIQYDGYGDHKVFVTIPRRHTGIPATLGYFNLRDVRNNQCPPVKPWPNAEVNDLKSDCGKAGYRIVSIWRPEIDKCGRLWAIDTGVLDLPDDKPYVVQPPTLKVWDTKSGELLKEIIIPAHIARDGRGLTFVSSDVQNCDCDSGYGYIPDSKNNQIIVVDIKSQRVWAIKDNSFLPNPKQGTLDINGLTIKVRFGVFDVVQSLDRKNLYYHAMASLDAWSIPLEQLRNESLCSATDLEVTYLGRRNKRGQTGSQWNDAEANVIWSLQKQQNSLNCWNPENPLSPETIGWVDVNSELNVDAMDLFVHEKDIYVLSVNFPETVYYGLDPRKKNFRILVGNKKECLANAPVCTSKLGSGYEATKPEPQKIYKSPCEDNYYKV